MAVKPKSEQIPCLKEGMSDVNYIRASASAKSNKEDVAREKAMLSAKQILSSLISSSLVSSINHYVSSKESSNDSEVKEIFESITRETVNQNLQKVKFICMKTQKLKEGYEVFVAVEMPRQVIINTLFEKFQDINSNIDIDEEVFRDIFEAEMKKIETK